MSRRSFRPVAVCRRALAPVLCLLALAACAVPGRAQSSQDPIYVFHTNLGDMRVQLYPDVTPRTVANFLSYVNSGAYNSSFIHRSARDGQNNPFVIQGGGYTVNTNGNVATIPTNGTVPGEAHLSNTRGTIAMALSTGPNSATDEWFFNEEDNSALLDGSQDGGPFTVFGRITDSASLAVMDAIGALPVHNEGSPFDELPLTNYQGGPIAQSNFVLVNSITPGWTATSASVGPEGNTHLLWDRADGAAAFWLLGTQGQFVSQQNYGPYSGWTAKIFATGSDGDTRVLWSNVSGAVTFWRVDSQNRFLDQQNYGPYSGWSVASMSVGPDGDTRVLWDNVNGASAFWVLDSQNRYVSQQNYGPYSGWAATSVSVGPDDDARVLWTNTSGAAALWRVDSQNRFLDQQNYGPYSGWAAASVSVGPDNDAHVLWSNANGMEAFWRVDADNVYLDQQNYGPFAGWAAQVLTAAPDGSVRALWTSVGGLAAFWDLDGSNRYISQQNYGPF